MIYREALERVTFSYCHFLFIQGPTITIYLKGLDRKAVLCVISWGYVWVVLCVRVMQACVFRLAKVRYRLIQSCVFVTLAHWLYF